MSTTTIVIIGFIAQLAGAIVIGLAMMEVWLAEKLLPVIVPLAVMGMIASQIAMRIG